MGVKQQGKQKRKHGVKNKGNKKRLIESLGCREQDDGIPWQLFASNWISSVKCFLKYSRKRSVLVFIDHGSGLFCCLRFVAITASTTPTPKTKSTTVSNKAKAKKRRKTRKNRLCGHNLYNLRTGNSCSLFKAHRLAMLKIPSTPSGQGEIDPGQCEGAVTFLSPTAQMEASSSRIK